MPGCEDLAAAGFSSRPTLARKLTLARQLSPRLLFHPAPHREALCPAGINRNRYIALMAAITLRENPGQTIVTDSW